MILFIMINYNDIFSFKNLYLAHFKARLGKRHKREVIDFELDLGNNIWKLKRDLDKRNYTIKGYNSFIITDPKKRLIQALKYSDRVVQHALVDNYLMPLLERHLIYDNGACRKNKGTDFCIKRVRMFLTKHFHECKNNGYILKFDIHHYFESIKHSILKDKLRKIVCDEDILHLLFKIIDSYSDYENSGLPIGNQTSQCFALYYLDIIDRLIKEKSVINFADKSHILLIKFIVPWEITKISIHITCALIKVSFTFNRIVIHTC